MNEQTRAVNRSNVERLARLKRLTAAELQYDAAGPPERSASLALELRWAAELDFLTCHSGAAAPGAARAPDRGDPPSPRQSKIVAVCGLDGSGKSSLVERLERDPALRGASCVRKRARDNVHAVLRAYSGFEHTADVYLHGAFAEAIRWAHGFDFLRFYEEQALPHLRRGALCISDRWAVCSIAYADAGPGLGRSIRGLLDCVPCPDLTIYLDVTPEEAAARILRRGAPNENEDITILRACADAYERWLAALPSPVVRVPSGDLEAIHARVAALVEQTWGDRP